ncbi:MAG: TetR/AcrR family transcriptional regulator [Methanospirillum sp.]|uniref:TetR/AcrR family transcriptional regulator n=1 Tax=Methanospirillum sp. TaxID=45200 RepID=UPI002373FF0B|nr:TetR/AcrR family transcriptional regulator [Methanospirillum sp.]MDD1730134.1 TetR/AcrR family transcriptional regulator [Methanospirillum sp.]
MPKVVPQYKEDAKQRIILAAMEVMTEKGYEETTIDEIAKKMGATKGAVYCYFRSKKELIQEVLMTMEREFERIAPDPFFFRYNYPELLPSFNRFYFIEERYKLLCEVGLFRDPGDINPEPTPESVHELVSVLEDNIWDEQRRGGLLSTERRMFALMLVSLCMGLQKGELYSLLFLGRPIIQKIWYVAMKHLLHPESIPENTCSPHTDS